VKVPASLSDEQVLFLSDILPTGYMAAEHCDIEPDDLIAVWGAGPVGQFAIRSAFLLGARAVVAIDCVPERLAMARAQGATPIDFLHANVYDELRELTAGRGPDACIDAVGLEAHENGSIGARYDRLKSGLYLTTDRLQALREAITSCGKGGTVSIPGVYGGLLDKVPLGAAFAKGLTLRMGQTHVHRYVPKLLDLIVQQTIDPAFVISHRFPLDEAPRAYALFHAKEDGCTKVVLTP
jgi:threonine dehydrogenase-like Zn-dependent dehydrogenase